MANVRDLNRRIGSLRNMQKVTRAMNMIATIKLRKVFALQTPLRAFSVALEGIVADIVRGLGGTAHPVLDGYPVKQRAHVVLFTADKGLCGAHNHSVQRELAAYVAAQGHENVAVDVTSVGLKGAHFCRRKGIVVYRETEIGGPALDLARLRRIATELFGRFTGGEVQEISILYNRFVSTLQQETARQQVLPLPAAAASAGRAEGQGAAGAVEPEPDRFALSAGAQCLYYALCVALCHSQLSENAARMTAMENATRNSQDLIGRYVTLQNRARQAAITSEIIEVVSGKEAMEE